MCTTANLCPMRQRRKTANQAILTTHSPAPSFPAYLLSTCLLPYKLHRRGLMTTTTTMSTDRRAPSTCCKRHSPSTSCRESTRRRQRHRGLEGGRCSSCGRPKQSPPSGTWRDLGLTIRPSCRALCLTRWRTMRLQRVQRQEQVQVVGAAADAGAGAGAGDGADANANPGAGVGGGGNAPKRHMLTHSPAGCTLAGPMYLTWNQLRLGRSSIRRGSVSNLVWSRRALHGTPGNIAPVADSRLTPITCTPATSTAATGMRPMSTS